MISHRAEQIPDFSTLTRAQRVLDDFLLLPPSPRAIEAARSRSSTPGDQCLVGAQAVLDEYLRSGIFEFNLVHKLGIRLSPEQRADALAALFDPTGPHETGLVPLKRLLAPLAASAHALAPRASALLALLEQSDGHAWMDHSDEALIVCGQDFLVLIESHGRDNDDAEDGESRLAARRARSRLEVECLRRDLAPDRALGVYLTAGGERHRDASFLPLSFGALAAALSTEASNPTLEDVQLILRLMSRA